MEGRGKERKRRERREGVGKRDEKGMRKGRGDNVEKGYAGRGS